MTEQEIFEQALDKTPEELPAFLEVACAGDAVLRRRLEALLWSHAAAPGFLDVPAVEQLAAEGPGLANLAPDLSFLAPSSEPDSRGRLDHYEVLEVVGRGGMGVVLRSRDTKLERVVALKVLALPRADAGAARRRFAREARAAAALRDEHVVAIHAVHDDAPVPYLVMEFIDGPNLADRLQRSGPLGVPEVLRIGTQVARGLAAAHAQGLIHRDVKPANILLENGVERVKLTDFGLARTADDPSLTQSGLIAGTPLYMSPEQAAGEALDARSDLFSLGSVLYEMGTGRPAFQATSTVAVIRRVCDERPRPIREVNPEVPEPLGRLIERLHAKRPADRPASAREVADQLDALLAGLSEPRTQRSGVSGSLRPAYSAALRARLGQHPWHWAAAALILLSVGLGLVEATGVTDVRGTVIRLLSPDGTLVVEVDDPGVSVTLDGGDVVITGAGAKEIRLKPGQYQVEASKDGNVVRRELVTVTRKGRQVVRLSQEAAPLTAAEAWEKSVAALPTDKQVEAVERRLRELNPEFRGRVESQILDGKVFRLSFLSDRVTDISPVRAIKDLKSLDCGGSAPRQGRLADLTPLRGMRLIRLNCAESQVSDLEPLRGMPLEYLHCKGTGVASLSPLEGMKLVSLTIQETPVSDLRPLRGMHLKWLDLCGARSVTDLLPLAGMPLEYLNVSEARVGDLSPLFSMKTLRFLVLDRTQVTDLRPLRNLRLEQFSFKGTAATDLTPIEGMPLQRLRLDYRPDREKFVRSFKGLQFINDKPAAVFWKEVDGK